jgi:YfiH family protein
MVTDPAGFTWRERDGVSWLAWESHGVHAAFPARTGGVSAPPFDSLNLGLSGHDDPEAVLENRRRLCAAVGVPQARLVVPGQVHGTALRWVGAAAAGRGAFDSASVVREHDGLLTAAAGLGLVVSYADCVPIVVVAEGDEGPLYATVHAGWRGMVAGIGGLAAAGLESRGGRLLAAAVGPSIGPCCFAVDDELRRRFAALYPGSAGSRTVDLWHCARLDLERAGVPADRVAVAGLCTSSDSRFFSHRRDAGASGRHLAIAWREEAEGGPQK